MIWFDRCPHRRFNLVYCTSTCIPCIWQKMIEEMTHRLVKLVRGALLPTTLPKSEQNVYGGWDNKTNLSGNWLTQIMHTVRLETASIMMIFMFIFSLMTLLCLHPAQSLSWGSICFGDSKWFTAGDPGSAAGFESSLSHGDSSAHNRRWAGQQPTALLGC